jgi:hypothetical protein
VTAEELIRTAGPVLQLLADETGETAVIVRRLGLAAVCLREIPSSRPLRVAPVPPSGDAGEDGHEDGVGDVEDDEKVFVAEESAEEVHEGEDAHEEEDEGR